MIAKQCVNTIILLLFLGAIFLDANVPLSHADILFSTDIPITIGSDSFEERDVISHESSSFAPYLSGSSLGIPEGVNIDAFGFSRSNILFSVDIPTTLDGVAYTERDLIVYDGTDFSKLLDGPAIGIPHGARIDAATVLSDGTIIFSLDIPVSLVGIAFKANDLISYDGSSFGLYFNGSNNGIPENANIDGVYVSPTGDILFSIDIPSDLSGLEVTDKDIIKWDGSSFSLYFDGLSSGLPTNADVNAVAVNPPVIDDISFDECISELCTSAISVTAHDPAGGVLAYTWEALDGGEIVGEGADVQFDPPDNGPHPCPYEVELTVTSDESGLSTSQTIDIYVKLAGDADGSGRVDIRDKRLVRDAFGSYPGHPNWDPRADVDCSGRVDIRDKRIVRNQFGDTGCQCP